MADRPTFLSGKLLLAMPGMADPRFERAVIAMCVHDENGAIGIGVGSLGAGYLSGNKIEYGLVPLGSIGMALCAALLSQPELGYGQVAALLAVLGFAGGFFQHVCGNSEPVRTA